VGKRAPEPQPPAVAPVPVLDLSCLDWRERLRDGRSLVPDLPLYQPAAINAVNAFNMLRLSDVPGTPTMEEAGGQWFRDIVAALFGSLCPVTGIRRIREVFALIPKKNSKALALDTLIATPRGFATMGSIRVGDDVLDSDGQPTIVTAKSEIFIDHDCFEVEFSTGEVIVCDGGHLWVTDALVDRDKAARDQRHEPKPSAKTTAQIAETLNARADAKNHRTSLCGVLDLARRELPISPYVLGAWLGDGETLGARMTSSTEDAAHFLAQFERVGQPARVTRKDPRSRAVGISLAGERAGYRFRTEAVRLDLLGNKHIPPAYLRASREQRLALLRGLMDTDGSMSTAGQACFTTTRPVLRDDIIELIASLGLKPTVSEHRSAIDGRDCGPYWLVQFWPFELEVFALPRKVDRLKAKRSTATSGRSRYRQIVAVRPVPSVPVQCISVASSTHQYLVTRSLIPTHNTTDGALMMLVALLLNLRPRARFIMTAPVQEVAETAFNAAAGAIALDPVLEAKLHVRDHVKTIIHRETLAELKIMTFDPAVLTGPKFQGALIDELHVVARMGKAPSALRQIRGNMMPFPEAFLAFITTQSEDVPVGVFKAELELARDVRDGKRKGVATLPVLYEFPKEFQQHPDKPWRNPKYWGQVTPNLGLSIDLDRLVSEFAVAESKGEDELRAWASQHLNVEIGLALRADSWVAAEFFEENAADFVLTLEELLDRCEVVTVGIDGGGLDDMLAAVVLGREKSTEDGGSPQVGKGRWLMWAHAWVHPIVLERHKQEQQRFHDFVKEGSLTIVEAIGQDVDEVALIVAQVDGSGLLDRVGVDQAGIGAIVEAMTDPLRAGLDVERVLGVAQGWRMVGAVKTVERKLAQGALLHNGSALLKWAFGNAKSELKGNASIITKSASGNAKIDPVLALLDAVTLMAMNPKARNREPSIMIFG
jgi:phage terminase large subunit-like protein